MVFAAYGSALSRSPTEEGELTKLSSSPSKRVPYAQQERLPPW